MQFTLMEQLSCLRYLDNVGCCVGVSKPILRHFFLPISMREVCVVVICVAHATPLVCKYQFKPQIPKVRTYSSYSSIFTVIHVRILTQLNQHNLIYQKYHILLRDLLHIYSTDQHNLIYQKYHILLRDFWPFICPLR